MSGEAGDGGARGAPRKIRIYTRTGDKGKSSLFDGSRVAKDEAVFETLGDLDEANAAIGLALVSPGDATLGEQLRGIQSRFLEAGAAVATPGGSEEKKARVRVDWDAAVSEIEGWVDAWDEVLPPLRTFILPGGEEGGERSARLHLARAIVRRAERRVVARVREGAVDEGVGRWVNRISDYLFVAARVEAEAKGGSIAWKGVGKK